MFRRQTKGFGGFNNYAPGQQNVPPPRPMPDGTNPDDPYDESSWGAAENAHMASIIRQGGGLIPGTGHMPFGVANQNDPMNIANVPYFDPVNPYNVVPPPNTTTTPGLGVMDGSMPPTGFGPAPGGYSPPNVPGMMNQGMMPTAPGTGMPTGTGADMIQYQNSVLGQGITSDMMNYALQDPSLYGMLYANEMGQPLNGGNFAMSQQYAGNMPTEYLMSPGANSLTAGNDEMASYYEQNINQGQQVNGGYYSTTDFLGQAMNPDSALGHHIWGSPGMEALTPPQQMSNFMGAFESVLGAGMSDEMMSVWGSRYMDSYNQYLIHIANGGSDMPLYEWFNSQGLGMPQQGQ